MPAESEINTRQAPNAAASVLCSLCRSLTHTHNSAMQQRDPEMQRSFMIREAEMQRSFMFRTRGFTRGIEKTELNKLNFYLLLLIVKSLKSGVFFFLLNSWTLYFRWMLLGLAFDYLTLNSPDPLCLNQSNNIQSSFRRKPWRTNVTLLSTSWIQLLCC